MAWQRSRVRVPLAPPGCRTRCHHVEWLGCQRAQRRPENPPAVAPGSSESRFRGRDDHRPHRVHRRQRTPSGETTRSSGRPECHVSPLRRAGSYSPLSAERAPSQSLADCAWYATSFAARRAQTLRSRGARQQASPLSPHQSRMTTEDSCRRASSEQAPRAPPAPVLADRRCPEQGSQQWRTCRKGRPYSRAGRCGAKRGLP